MKKNLFRKSSIERISSPERLNEYIKITNPGVWSILAGCLIILSAAFIWMFYGSIPNTVEAKGIIFPENGVTSLIPVSGGRITDMRVKVGDYVEAGQIITVIPQEDILSEIEKMKTESEDEESYKKLLSEYERKSVVISPISGIVLYAANTNETVSSTEAVAQIVKQEKYSDSKQIISYIPSKTAKKLKEGMEVQVSPDFASREEYGYMYGHITRIGTYPVSGNEVLKALGDTQYADSLMPVSDCVEVRTTLTVDPDSQSKIKWSNKKGEILPVTIGTYADMIIIVKNYRPFELVFK